MRKSFKKGLAMALAAAMVFSTPVAVNKTVSVAAETESALDMETLQVTGTAWKDTVPGKERTMDSSGEMTLYIYGASENGGIASDVMAEIYDGSRFFSTDTQIRGWQFYEGNSHENDVTKTGEAKGIKYKHLYKVTFKKASGKLAIEYYDVTADESCMKFETPDTGFGDALKVKITGTFGTVNVISGAEPIANALLGDVKASLSSDGTKIEVSYDWKMSLDGLTVATTVSGSSTKVEGEPVAVTADITAVSIYIQVCSVKEFNRYSILLG